MISERPPVEWTLEKGYGFTLFHSFPPESLATGGRHAHAALQSTFIIDVQKYTEENSKRGPEPKVPQVRFTWLQVVRFLKQAKAGVTCSLKEVLRAQGPQTEEQGPQTEEQGQCQWRRTVQTEDDGPCVQNTAPYKDIFKKKQKHLKL